MSKIFKILIFLFVFALSCNSCSSEEILEEVLPKVHDINNPDNYFHDNTLGKINAVKKAHQLTDLHFTLVSPIEGNGSRVFEADKDYQGVFYSSVKEIGTYVGSYVSLHTFMTAIHNPRSKIYTERIDSSPYHGVNCKIYYGIMCSGLVSYALGIDYATFDFPISDLMVEVDYNDVDNIDVADVIVHKTGHVALITDVERDSAGHVISVEICEANEPLCKRYYMTAHSFEAAFDFKFESIYRYTELYKNIEYTPANEFVAVDDETPEPFVYNDDLCADKGDKACYREDEDVVINIMRDYNYLEIYKDGAFYLRKEATSERDIRLQKLPYGDYSAHICYGDSLTSSESTYWKVVNMSLTPNRKAGRLYFKSANAIPYRISFTDLSGSRKYPFTKIFSYTLTDEDRARGYIEIPENKTNKGFPYIHFFFSSEYGKIQYKILNWFE